MLYYNQEMRKGGNNMELLVVAISFVTAVIQLVTAIIVYKTTKHSKEE